MSYRYVYTLLFIIILIYLFTFMLNKSKYKPKKYKLAIMAIFKKEQDYMEEWLDHHIRQGISHFYLYNNDPELNNYQFLNDQKYKNFITLVDWVNAKNDGRQTIQKQAYQHCVRNYNKQYNMIMMLDLDEFIINNEKGTVLDYINSLDIEKTKAIKVPRYNYGSNGYIVKPFGKVMQNFRMRERLCSSYKTIANSDYINIKSNFYGVHDFPYIYTYGKIYNNYFTYKQIGYPNGCTEHTINETPLMIKHYYTKSKQEYMNRCKLWDKGGINPIMFRKNCENSFEKADVNEIID